MNAVGGRLGLGDKVDIPALEPETQYALSSLVKLANGKLAFSIYQILEDPDLLFNTAEKLSAYIDADERIVIAIGDFGIPLGVAVGLISKRRIGFFNRYGFPKPNVLSKKKGASCQPNIPPGTKTVQIDSHILSGYTSLITANKLISEFDVNPTKHITPLSFSLNSELQRTQYLNWNI